MNVTAIANSISKSLSIGLGRTKLILKAKMPDILMATGVGLIVGGGVSACVTTAKKLDDIRDNCEEVIESVKEHYAYDMTDPDYKRDLTKAYVHNVANMAKIYIPSVLMTAAGIGCIVSSHSMMKNQNVALASAYSAVDNAFKNYRKNVIESEGEEADKRYLYNIKHDKIENEYVDESGKKKKKKEDVEYIDGDPNNFSPYARFFDESSREWVKDSESNFSFVKLAQTQANNRLHLDGHLFLNDVYDMLGLEPTRAGQRIGWYYDKNDPTKNNFVDFGIMDVKRKAARDFVNGYERSILLDFNVDGDIISMLADDLPWRVSKDDIICGVKIA